MGWLEHILAVVRQEFCPGRCFKQELRNSGYFGFGFDCFHPLMPGFDCISGHSGKRSTPPKHGVYRRQELPL
jgi:hypothetical protein